jgi:hypothetical protein
MDALKSILKMATEISNNFQRVNEINIKKSTGAMLNLNEEQMDAGILNTGAKIKPFYSDPYAKKKGFRIPNLKLEGDFRGAMFVDIDINKESITFDSSDWKVDILTDRYTKNIFGLTKDNANKAFNDYVYKPNNQYINGVVQKTL